MKILVVTGSPRKGGNTEIMAQAFTEAAMQNGQYCHSEKAQRVKSEPLH